LEEGQYLGAGAYTQIRFYPSPERHQFSKFPRIQRRHLNASAGTDGYHSSGREYVQCFAYRGEADTELMGDRSGGQDLTGCHGPGNDLTP
jgi:hypothetical protein